MLNIAFLSVFSCNSFRKSTSTTHRPTYGIKSSPLTQIAFLFSALVHDVDHTGISNRQLVLESDNLAILYNDQSVAEQRSLAVAFSTLKGVGYRELRGVLFSGPRGGDGDTDDEVGGQEQQQQNQGGEEDQFKFRKLVIDLVLVTDIASPERTQIVKSKWKEAFGEVQFAEKLKKSNSKCHRKHRGCTANNNSNGGDDEKKSETAQPTVKIQYTSSQSSSNNINNSTNAENQRATSNKPAPERYSLLSMKDESLDNDFLSSTSSLLSDSLEDDFDASAVSRTKMNLDSNSNSLNSLNDGLENSNKDGKDPVGSARESFSKLPTPQRHSTGDIAKMDLMSSPQRLSRRDRSAKASLSASTTDHNLDRRKPASTARSGLSRSMITRPRAHSEERRLGVRRALDLAGSTIEPFNSNKLRSSVNSNSDMDFLLEDDLDDVDEFKATVVLEQMLRAADVGALLQDWNNWIKWSTRLYKELKNGHLANRGEDPNADWFDNQIKFVDFYILPLAKNLGMMGVFEEDVGKMFVRVVKSNLAKWIEEGERVTELMMKEYETERKRLAQQPRRQQNDQTSSSLSVVSMSRQESSKTKPAYRSFRKVTRTRSLETGDGRSCVVCGVVGR